MLAVDDNPTLATGHGQFLLSMVARWDNDPNAAQTVIATGTLFSKRGSSAAGVGPALIANNAAMMTKTGGATAAVGTSLWGTSGSTYNDNKFRIISLVRDLAGNQCLRPVRRHAAHELFATVGD